MVEQVGGSHRPHLLWTDEGPFCASRRLARTLAARAVTGWEEREATVRLKSGRALSDYVVLEVRGRSAPLDCSRAERIATLTPEGRGTAWIGARVDVRTWDGSDFFRAGVNGPVLVTERVARAFEAAEVSNVVLRPLTAVVLKEDQVIRVT